VPAFWKFVSDDWCFAIPMFALSFAALTMLFWRILLNLNTGTDLDAFWPAIEDKLDEQGIEGTIRWCRSQRPLIPGQLCVAGLAAFRQGPGAVRRALASLIELEVLPQLNFLLAPILAIAKIATMVGLLGTVISMIQTFNAISEASDDLALAGQASSIGLALFATALGLMTAIPLVFAHVLLKAWVHKSEVKLKRAAEKLVTLAQTLALASAQPAEPSPPVFSELPVPDACLPQEESVAVEPLAANET
jgi:biopolymer transport protein ExbB